MQDMINTIDIYDTTLRDGSQMQGISLSVFDKLRIAKLLDELGVKYIEGGWPGANPKDVEFFQKAKSELELKNAKLVAFGSTKRLNTINCEEDSMLQALLKAETKVITIVAKSWGLHVESALNTTLEKNLELIVESIKYLKSKNKEVFLDAEHFFDGYKDNPEYSKLIIKASVKSGADGIILCDTNGGALPREIYSVLSELKNIFPAVKFGIHAHNDGGLALANTLAAVEAGALQIQGTINGYGERCGNADLIASICNLELKMNKRVFNNKENLKKISHISRSISEIANMNLSDQHPFTGVSAFRHKGGLHASAMRKDSRTYEHIDPRLVGNKSSILVSEQSGLSNILDFAKSKGIEFEGYDAEKTGKELLEEIKRKEHAGYQYEQADASLVLLLLEKLGKRPNYFNVTNFKVISSLGELSEATVQVHIADKSLHVASLGVGPGHALDQALRKALEEYYFSLKEFKLNDFKVRVIDSKDGTAAKTRVQVETVNSDGKKWNTIGVSPNVVEATFEAIKESIEYGLYMLGTGET